MTEKYYINYSFATNRYLVKKIGEGKIIKIFDTKKEAENYVNELNASSDYEHTEK